jgi:glutathione S-transferase
MGCMQCSTPFWLSLWTEGEVQKGHMAEIKGKRFFGGDAVGLVDIAASGFAHWLPVFEEVAGVSIASEEEFPDLCRWGEEYASHETVKQCLPDRATLLAHFMARKDIFKSTLPK